MGLPNVIAFKLTDPKPDEMASTYSIIKGNRVITDVKRTRRLTKANKYLGKQFRRLLKYAKEGDKTKFNLLAGTLLLSFSFQVQAYNSVFPRWLAVKHSTVAYHLRYLRTLCYKLDTDLKYTRIWIEKKPGDFERPLGVPDLVWRVYLRMLTNLGEVYLQGTGKYSSFQHGGRPGRGVMSCLREMVEKLGSFSRVYEFDLKGFFDHICKDAVAQFFKGTVLARLYRSMLDAKPYKYPNIETFHHPAKEKWDQRAFEKLKWHGFKPWKVHPLLTKINEEIGISPERQLQLDLIDFEAFGGYKNSFDPNNPEASEAAILAFDEYDLAMQKDGSGGELYKAMTLEEQYSDLHKGEPVKFSRGLYIDPGQLDSRREDLEKGRDRYKDLNLPDQGIPQGTSFGPMLASTIGAYYLRGIPNLLMYVDDGMVFLNESDPSPEEKIKTALKKIKVEIAPEKSFLREIPDLQEKGIKFLGTRSRRKVGEGGAYVLMSSETRRGTAKPLPMPNPQEFDNVIRMMFEAGMISFSKQKLLRWYVLSRNSRLGQFLNSQSLDIAMKWGFFGNLLAEAYNPGNSTEDMKLKIAEGMEKARIEILRREDSYGSALLQLRKHTYISEGGDELNTTATLYNLSTLGCEILLELGVTHMLRRRDRPRIERVTYVGKLPEE